MCLSLMFAPSLGEKERVGFRSLHLTPSGETAPESLAETKENLIATKGETSTAELAHLLAPMKADRSESSREAWRPATIESVRADDRHVVIEVLDADPSPTVTHHLFRHTSPGFRPPSEGTLVLEDLDLSTLPVEIVDGPNSLHPPRPDTEYSYRILSRRGPP